jgi:hypothetical protein
MTGPLRCLTDSAQRCPEALKAGDSSRPRRIAPSNAIVGVRLGELAHGNLALGDDGADRYDAQCSASRGGASRRNPQRI